MWICVYHKSYSVIRHWSPKVCLSVLCSKLYVQIYDRLLAVLPNIPPTASAFEYLIKSNFIYKSSIIIILIIIIIAFVAVSSLKLFFCNKDLGSCRSLSQALGWLGRCCRLFLLEWASTVTVQRCTCNMSKLVVFREQNYRRQGQLFSAEPPSLFVSQWFTVREHLCSIAQVWVLSLPWGVWVEQHKTVNPPVSDGYWLDIHIPPPNQEKRALTSTFSLIILFSSIHGCAFTNWTLHR